MTSLTVQRLTGLYTNAVFGIWYRDISVAGEGEIEANQLPSFVDCSNMVQHYLSDEGMKAACRVLSVVAYERPDITYSPLLFTLTAILLHYLDEAACYTCVSSLVTSRRRYFAQTMISYQAQILTLSDLALKHVVCMFSCSKVIDYHIHQGQYLKYKENSAGMLISASSMFRIWLRGGHDLKAPQSSGSRQWGGSVPLPSLLGEWQLSQRGFRAKPGCKRFSLYIKDKIVYRIWYTPCPKKSVLYFLIPPVLVENEQILILFGLLNFEKICHE